VGAPAIHRCTGDSKRGRQLLSELGRIDTSPGLTDEQKAWNAAVDKRKQERAAASPTRATPQQPSGEKL
jgi:hypothetical protein